MCGNGKCIYYGCGFCLKYMKDPVTVVKRDECDCTNDIYTECCDDKCADAYVAEYEGDNGCTCGSTAEFSRSYGPSTL